MKRFTLLVLFASLSVTAARLPAQEIELPEYTMEQRWQRLAGGTVWWQAAMIALGEAQGMTPEEVGHWAGKFFTQGWLGGGEASWYLRASYRNFMSWPGAELEILNTTPTSVTARFNRPIDDLMGAGGKVGGIKLAEFDAMYQAVDETIADWVGVGLERQSEDGHEVVTYETLYGPIHARDNIRWNRNSYLSWLNGLQLMSIRMESGMSAREIGEADADLYAPTWNVQTPWALYRGMVWNQMSDPNFECAVISASPEEVRARCLQHYRELVLAQQDRFNVTPEDVFEAGRAFAEGVAEHLGMRWTEELVDGYREITVTRR